MEMETEEDVVPESPPISQCSQHISQFSSQRNDVDEESVEMDIQDDSDLVQHLVDEEQNIEDFDSDTELQAAKKETKISERCNFNVVIDIDEDSSSPAAAASSNHVDKSKSKAKGLAEAIFPDDPFASDDDDVVIMAQVEQLERSLVEANEPPQEDFEIDLQQLEEKEKRRQEEFQNLKRLGPNERIFPDVRSTNFHTVAFFMKPDYVPGDELVSHPQVFQSKWDPQFVPMPRDRENVRVFRIKQKDNPQDEGSPVFVEKTIWMWQRIDQSLKTPMLNCQDIASGLKHYCRVASELRALNYAIETIMSKSERDIFFAKTLPLMQTLCLDFSRIVTSPIPLLGKFSNYSISLSQKQIACLLANAFFSTFPKRLRDENQFPSINFIELFQCLDEDDNSRLVTKAHKIRCILNYFTRISDEMPVGVVTFTRRSIRNSKAPEWHNSTKKLLKILPLSEGTIEDDGVGMLQVDFANKIIGGGVLGGGAVQEEILFVTYPELLISRLFTEKLTSCEALIVTGCERFSRYSGYARNFRFDGDFYDVTPFDLKGRKCTQIVAIDALYITRPITQFHPRFLTRELNKAYVGFSSPSSTSGSAVPVATGKWGCGAFNGNPQLKAILQLMAASQAGRDVVFFTFGDLIIQNEIDEMYQVIKDMTIQQVWNLLCQYHSLFCVTPKTKYTLCRFLKEFGSHPPPPQAGPSSAPGSEASAEQSTEKKLKEVPITKFYSRDGGRTYQKVNGETKDVENASDEGQASTSNSTSEDAYKNNWKGSVDLVKNKKSSVDKNDDGSLSDQQISHLLLNEQEGEGAAAASSSVSQFIKTFDDNKPEEENSSKTKTLHLTDFYNYK